MSRRIETSEPDVIAAGLIGGCFDYMPVAGKAFQATLRTLRVGDFLVQQVDDSPHLVRAAFDRGLVGIVVPLRYRGAAALVNGCDAGDASAFVAPGGAEVNVACPDAVDWAALALPRSLLEELAEDAAPALRRPTSGMLLRFPHSAAARLSGALRAAARLADDLPEALAQPGCADGLAMAMREMLGSVLTAQSTPLPTGRAAREAVRVVRGAEDYLHANLHRPIYRDELRTMLGVSHRKLHDAFVATVGMAPATYLKLRRLVLARRALLKGGTSQSLVKSVALAHGFWHFGHFAKDYRALFGERPSDTIARGRDGGSHPAASFARSG